MKRPQQRRDGQTVSEVGRLVVLANSPKGRQLAARPPQAQCRTKHHILPLLPRTTNYNRITTELQHTKKRAWFACISQQTIQRRCGVYLARHMRQLQAAGAPPASGKRPNDKSIANKKNETSKKNNQGTSNNNQSITNEHQTTRTTNQLTCTVASITLVCSAGSIGTWAATPTSRNSVRDVPNASDSLWQTDKLRVSSWKGVNWGGLIAHSN
jgi:hypothetical protein